MHREITDLVVWGSVGELPLAWTRHAHSRYNAGTGTLFGDAHGWRHSYLWQMVGAGKNASNQWMVDIYYPAGDIYRYTLVGANWTGVAAAPDKLIQNNTALFTLQRADGTQVRFDKIFLPDGSNYHQLKDIIDAAGNTYAATFDASKRLALITEPAGRFLKINYQDITANQAEFQNLVVLPTTIGAGWSEVTVSNPATFRYLRYLGPSATYSTVAEIEFYDTAGNKLSGTPFGADPASAAGREYGKAFDGNTGTYYDYANKSFGFTGIDLGAGNAKRIGKIRFFPKAGMESRMSTGNFQGSNVAPVVKSVIASVETSDGRSVTYDYVQTPDPILATNWVCLSGAEYGDGTAATYGYAQVWPGIRPHLVEANDPRFKGAGTRMKYEYWTNDHITGNLKAEKNYVTGTTLAQLDGITGDSSQVTYPGGVMRKYNYPSTSAGRVSKVTDSLNRATDYTYGAGGQGFVASIKNPAGQTTSYTRDTQGRVLSVTFPDNSTQVWTRDSLGLVLTAKDELGRITTYTRDVRHRVTRIDYPDASFETFTYDTFGQVLTHQLKNGATEQNAYDARGLKTSATDPLGNVTALTYDANDRLESITDPRGNTTAYEYDERGLRTATTYADGSTTSATYDVYGNRTSVTNELGNTWTYTYDEFNRKITETDPLNRTTTYSYALGTAVCGSCHSDDQPTQITSPSGKVTKITYDNEGQKTSETVGFGSTEAATTSYAYDATGNVATQINALGKSTVYAYDNRNQRISVIDPLGNKTEWTYDGVGNRATEKKPNGGTTTNLYDIST